MSILRFRFRWVLMLLVVKGIAMSSATAQNNKFRVLYSFEAPAPVTFTSALGSQPDTLPAPGPGDTVYGMTSAGGDTGNGVIYRFDMKSHSYTMLHTFSALDANGHNEDGYYAGVALTRGPDDDFYGMASFGGGNGTGTVFKITAAGKFTVLHTFSALNADGTNDDGASPLRAIVIGEDGKLYGTTRVGGTNLCTPAPGGCGVAWVMDRDGKNFKVVHQFTSAEGHAASLLQARDGLFYGCAVWPATAFGTTPLPSGILYRMKASGKNFEVLYTFTQTDANGENADGADCYEPLVETRDGVFYGTATRGGTNGNGAVFQYSVDLGTLEVVHEFSATTAGENLDGAYPYARLTRGRDCALYSTTSYGGMNGNGVVYRIGRDDSFDVLHTFSATDATTGANEDGATPDFGVIFDERSNSVIGMTDYGGNGSSAGFYNSGGTLYRIKVSDGW